MRRITRTCLTLSVVAALLALGGCASGPDVRVNTDTTVNFAQYKSFAFASPLGTDRNGYQTIVSGYLKAAAQRELEARGLRLDEQAPQLLVNFNGSLSDKVRVTRTPAPTFGMGYYGYRYGLYGAWPLYRDETTVTPYKEGTLNVDVVDQARKQLVWEGIVSDSVAQQDMDRLQLSIDKAVAAAFAKFPVAAPAKAP